MHDLLCTKGVQTIERTSKMRFQFTLLSRWRRWITTSRALFPMRLDKMKVRRRRGGVQLTKGTVQPSMFLEDENEEQLLMVETESERLYATHFGGARVEQK